MNIAAWNVRGLNQPLKQMEVRKYISGSSLGIIGLSETKVRTPNIESTCKQISTSFSYFGNHSNHGVARILLLWDPMAVKINIITSSSQAVFCHIDHQVLSMDFFATFVYASKYASK